MIESLTKEQEAKFSFYVEKWLKIGLCCDPIDKKAATEAVNLSYTCAGVTPPEKIYFVNSPVEHVSLMIDLTKNEKKKFKKIDFVNDMIYGLHEAGWLSRFDFFRNECGLVKETDKILGIMACAENIGWWAPYKNVAVVQERPLKVVRDTQNRLHCEDGPAILYRDGYSQHYWHGVFVKNSEIITNPEKITIEMIDGESNAEIRRIALLRFGYDRYVKESKMQTLDSVDINDTTAYKGIRGAKLLSKKMPDDEDLVVLALNNSTPEKEDGSIKKYIIRVPPNMRSVKEASAWINFSDDNTYNPIVET